MYKIIYLPTAQLVELYECRPYRKEELDRYMTNAFYFYMAEDGPQITTYGGGRFRERSEGKKIIRKHLLEIIEVPDE